MGQPRCSDPCSQPLSLSLVSVPPPAPPSHIGDNHPPTLGGDEAFGAAAVSLGLLGVMVKVKIQLIEAKNIKETIVNVWGHQQAPLLRCSACIPVDRSLDQLRCRPLTLPASPPGTRTRTPSGSKAQPWCAPAADTPLSTPRFEPYQETMTMWRKDREYTDESPTEPYTPATAPEEGPSLVRAPGAQRRSITHWGLMRQN